MKYRKSNVKGARGQGRSRVSDRLKTAAELRGGFTNPIAKRAGKIANEVGRGYFAGGPDGAKKAAASVVLQLAQEAQNYGQQYLHDKLRNKGVNYGQAPSTPEAPIHGGDKPIQMVGTSSTVRRRVLGGAVVGKRHKTGFTLGKPTSKTLFKLARMNGSVTQTNWNTLIDSTLLTSRESLAQNCGFNRKQCWTVRELQLTAADLALEDRVFADPGYKGLRATDQVNLAAVLGIKRNIRIKNTGRYLPMYFKISLLMPVKDTMEWDNYIQAALPTQGQVDTNDNSTQGSVPAIYWRGPRSSNSSRIAGEVDPKCSLMSSSRARKRFQVMKTFTKKLGPQDTWDFDLAEPCGSGIDLGLIHSILSAATESARDNLMMGCLISFEMWGVPCEGIDVDTGYQYIGSSPANCLIEFRKSLSWVKAPTNATDVQSVQIGGMAGSSCLIRSWQKYASANSLYGTLEQTYSRPAGDITDNTTAAGKFFIPVMTDALSLPAGRAKGGS